MSGEQVKDFSEMSPEELKKEELRLLKERADQMGVKYSPNIGIEKLKAKIDAKMAGETIPPEYAGEEADTIAAADEAANADLGQAKMRPTLAQIRAQKRKEALRLVRIRVADMNPINANLKGAIISAGNADIGMVKKYIPFNAEQGWHVPNIILKQLRQKQFMTYYTVKDPRTGKDVKRTRLVNQYSIEVMPPLTAKELNDLKQRQIIASQG